jgi:hypothetical protein
MSEEWRLSIGFTDQPGAGKRFYYATATRKVLRSRFGDDVVISAEKSRIFLYTGSADVGREAELASRQVLAQQGLLAGKRLEACRVGSYGQVLDAVEEVGTESLDRSGHLDALVAREEFFEDNAQLEPGQAGAEAEVGSAAAEGDVRVGLAGDVEGVG